MQVRREASSCESASELLKTLTTHDAWEALGEQIYEELHAVSKGDADKSVYYSPATGWLLEDMCSDIAVYRREAAATRIQACWRGRVDRVECVENPSAMPQEQRLCHKSMKQFYDAHALAPLVSAYRGANGWPPRMFFFAFVKALKPLRVRGAAARDSTRAANRLGRGNKVVRRSARSPNAQYLGGRRRVAVCAQCASARFFLRRCCFFFAAVLQGG